MITTVPGFSSRSTETHITQLSQRDGVAMYEQEPGWSNGATTEDEKAAQKAHDAQTYPSSLQVEAGFSNSAPADGASVKVQKVEDAPADVSVKVVEAAVKPAKKAAKKAPAKAAAKTAQKKG